MKFAGTVDVGPSDQESALDSSPLGTLVTSALAELFSECRVALGILLACLHFQCTVWRASDWKGWPDSEGPSETSHPYILADAGLPGNERSSVQSTQVSDSAGPPARSLVFVPCFRPSASLVPCVPSDAGCSPVVLHHSHDLVGNT